MSRKSSHEHPLGLGIHVPVCKNIKGFTLFRLKLFEQIFSFGK
jgi:hypothetical protein